MAEAQEISKGVSKALKKEDSEELGSLMLRNHYLLRKIGVSHPKLDQLVDSAMDLGALGAKLTGAGGGGCIVAVCRGPRDREAIAKKLRRIGGFPFNISRDTRGVVSSLGRALK